MEKNYNGDLILLRGIPGSGKSTLAEVILMWPSTDGPDIISADDYFITENGEYKFDATKLKEAHNNCHLLCARKMELNSWRIVVANTFTQEWEMKPYYDLAERHNYRVHSLIVENRHGNSNVHNVPIEKIEEMKKRFNIKL